MKLTEHFDSAEFVSEADENANITQHYYLLCLLVLEPVRIKFGSVYITSGYRTAQDQERLEREGYHPSKTSQHLFGEACDFVCPGVNMAEVYEFITKELAWPGETIYYPKRGHVHVSLPHIGVEADHFIQEA